ncbi:hypothetical protein [Segetibacter koreensis]|uniref:hypothetical protein n=1 Tax=Segetibacter koreensis TaxID=398037 RepID=UPI0003686D9D|nr:hypothetical protein [Segetibacter koreensis]
MNKSPLILIIFCIITGSCHRTELSHDEALKQLKQEKDLSGVLGYDIYCSDPIYARKVLEAGLESAGLVTVQRTQKLVDAGKPLIVFTPKSQSFLLPTPDIDKATHIQKVKLADEDVIEVDNVRTNSSGDKALVEYSTAFKNVTPFAKLTTVDFNRTKTNKAYFVLSDEGWKLQKKPDVSYMDPK